MTRDDDGTQVGLTVEFDADAASVSAARSLVRRAAAITGVDQSDAELAASEIVTNVVRHAATHFQLSIVPLETGLRVEVSDGSGVLPAVHELTDDADGGRGLHLVQAVTRRWGIDVGPRGKTVWFELDPR